MNDFKVTMMLADSAQAAEGKLYILGGGWSVIGPAPTPFAIAIKIEVPWDLANRNHQFLLRLEDQDGHPFKLDGTPIELGGGFEVGRPTGLQPGVPIDSSLAINFGPVSLPPGSRFLWRLFLNGGSRSDWTLGFSTRRNAA